MKVQRFAVILFVLSGALAAATGSDAQLIQRLFDARAAGDWRPLPDYTPPSKRSTRPGPGTRVPNGRGGTDSVIRGDFACNDDVIGGTSQQGPEIAVMPDGGMIVTWHEFRDGDADVWFQRLDSAGNTVGANTRMNDDVTMGWQGDPSVAAGPGGVSIATWEDRREIGNSDLFSQMFDAGGARQGTNFRVSDSVADGDQDASGVHIGPDGVALAAWDDRRNGLTGDIFAQFLNPDGSRRDSNFRVNDDGIGQANQYEPSVSGDDSGRFVLVWMDGRGHNAYDWNIFCQRFGPAGNRLGANIQVTSDDSIQWSPALACGRGGEFVVCWDDRRRGGQYDVYAQRYDASGSPAGANFRINDDAGTGDQYGGSVAKNRYGEFIVTWSDKRSGPEDIYARLYQSDGTPQGSSFRVNDDAGATVQVAADVAALPDGGYALVWIDARSGNYDIYYQRFGRNGAPIGVNRRLNDDDASSQQRVSSIAMETGGRICVAWEDERNGATDIYRFVGDATGQSLGPNLRLNSDGAGGAAQYYSAVAGGHDRFLAAWVDYRNGSKGDIYAQYMNGDGQLAGPNFKVNSDDTVLQWYPYCAMDSFNNALAVWMDSRNGGFQMYARRFDAAGNPVGAEFPVSDTTTAGYYASVAMNRSGRSVVSWMDPRDGDYNIYCQVFRADGSRVGPNLRVNTDGGGAYQSYPACAVDEEDRFAVAWEDTRNDYYNVYLQWFDSSGVRLGDNERVDDGPVMHDRYSPSCAFAPGGNLAVMFNDERDHLGNPQVYCQRFRSDRSRISFNQRVNEPNSFPNDHHWTVAQSIAASDDALAFAWTGNHRHQGWDVIGKVTDWNLIGIRENPGTGPVRPVGVPTLLADRLLTLDEPGPASVAVFDVMGRRVVQSDWPGPGVRLDLSNLSPGAYFVRVRGTAGTRTFKVILN